MNWKRIPLLMGVVFVFGSSCHRHHDSDGVRDRIGSLPEEPDWDRVPSTPPTPDMVDAQCEVEALPLTPDGPPEGHAVGFGIAASASHAYVHMRAGFVDAFEMVVVDLRTSPPSFAGRVDLREQVGCGYPCNYQGHGLVLAGDYLVSVGRVVADSGTRARALVFSLANPSQPQFVSHLDDFTSALEPFAEVVASGSRVLVAGQSESVALEVSSSGEVRATHSWLLPGVAERATFVDARLAAVVSVPARQYGDLDATISVLNIADGTITHAERQRIGNWDTSFPARAAIGLWGPEIAVFEPVADLFRLKLGLIEEQAIHWYYLPYQNDVPGCSADSAMDRAGATNVLFGEDRIALVCSEATMLDRDGHTVGFAVNRGGSHVHQVAAMPDGRWLLQSTQGVELLDPNCGS